MEEHQFYSRNFLHEMSPLQLHLMYCDLISAHNKSIAALETKLRTARHYLVSIDFYINRNQLDVAVYYLEKEIYLLRSMKSLSELIKHNYAIRNEISTINIYPRATSTLSTYTIDTTESGELSDDDLQIITNNQMAIHENDILMN